jgi:PTS system ascorbate-specific IIA component
MSVALLLITHDTLGADLVHTATKMLGRCPLETATLTVTLDGDPDLLQSQAQGMLEAMDQGDGVLVMTDMYGSTPSNIANRLLAGHHAAVVAGLNLPMLVRVLNYAGLDLAALSEKARSGGCDGIIVCNGGTGEHCDP